MSYIHTLIICISSCSSGVYFNDSTKAVLSANSDSFVYIERRKSNTEGPTEPVASYTLSDYPEDTLKKKVTLLQHFRNYLSEQQKRAEDTGKTKTLISGTTMSVASEDMIYMKKWIKTKHAMLFRLSNDTVQVQFNDETQVLISSEGNLITFVDKEENRTLHSISDIANNQQTDVSKRLKYAKEILSQLISGTKR
jgi:polo-like kinase 1